MKTLSPSLTACLVVGVSCLIWTAAITLTMVHFLGLSSSMGWTIAGSLALSSLVAVAFILNEMRNAIELPDSVEHPELEWPTLAGHWNQGMAGASAPGMISPAFRL